MKIIGYYIHKDDKEINSNTVMVFVDDNLRNNNVLGYCPQGQHFECDRDYINDCKEITLEEYKEASKLFYTPKIYLTKEETN